MNAASQSPTDQDIQVYYRHGRHRSQSSSSSAPIIVQPTPYRIQDMQYQTPIIIPPQRRQSPSYPRMAPVTMVIQEPSRTVSPMREPHIVSTQMTDVTVRELEAVINDFSSYIVVATFLASVSVAILSLAQNLLDSPSRHKTSLNDALHIALQVFTSLSLSFNLSVAIIAGSAASSTSIRLRLQQRATDFTRSQALDTKLSLCSTLQYYGLLALTVGTACLFGLMLDSPFAILMIVPVVGVVFYDSLYRVRVGSRR